MPGAARHVVIRDIDAATHRPHALHSAERIWVEKNCYVDLWIELLAARGLEPLACMPFVLSMDFEGDQWTFFKPPLTDLRRLYGIDVQELTVWRPLLDHAVEHLSAGKLLTVEVDAFWLPDTVATDYRHAHSKTTIALNDLDLSTRRLGYFHNAGYFALEGEDFDQIFATQTAATALPPYAEMIRIDRVTRRSEPELRSMSLLLLDQHLAWRPVTNPVARFAQRFAADLPSLHQAGLTGYHRWAFAGVRQLGAAFELAAAHLRWLQGGDDLEAAAVAFERIAQHSKAFILKAARAVNAGRSLDATPLFVEMAEAWDRGMEATIAWRERAGT
jgi:Domain of unknown function (DUF1839)